MNAPSLSLDLAPALVVLPGPRAAIADGGGGRAMRAPDARDLFERGPVLVAHAALTARRLGLSAPPRSRDLFDALELYAFARPARFCAPSAVGLAQALGLLEPASPADQAQALQAACRQLLIELAEAPWPSREEALAVAETLGRAAWAWAPAVTAALRTKAVREGYRGSGLDVWARIPEWEDQAPPGEPGSRAIDGQAARDRLAELLARSGLDEARPTQADFAPRGRLCVPAARARGRTAHDAGRGGHGGWQDAGLSGAGQPVGRGQWPGRLGLDLYPRPTAPDRAREPLDLSRRRHPRAQGRGAQGA